MLPNLLTNENLKKLPQLAKKYEAEVSTVHQNE